MRRVYGCLHDKCLRPDRADVRFRHSAPVIGVRRRTYFTRDMTRDDSLLPTSVGARLRHWIFILVVGVMVYLFSLGPALSLVHRGYVSPTIVSALYAPVPLKIRLWYWKIWKRIDPRCAEKLLALEVVARRS